MYVIIIIFLIVSKTKYINLFRIIKQLAQQMLKFL
jgi:hypothetical protein